MAHADRHRVLLKPVGDRPQPGGDGLHQEFSGIRGVKPGVDLALHFPVYIREPADLSVSPSLKDRDRGIPENGLHECVDRPVEKVLHMFLHDAFHSTGIDKIADLLAEGTDLLIDAPAVGKPSGDGVLRLRAGDDDRLGKGLSAPVSQGGHPGDAACQEEKFREMADLAADLLQARCEHFPEGFSLQLRRRLLQDPLSKGRIHFQFQAVLFHAPDRHRLHAAVPAPVVLVGKILFLESARGEFTVAAPGRALFKNPSKRVAVRGSLHGSLQQKFVHNAAAQGDFSGCLQLDLAPAVDIGKICRRGSHIHDQHRAGEDVVANLKMPGLAGADQSSPRLRDDAHRGVSRRLKNLAVALAL